MFKMLTRPDVKIVAGETIYDRIGLSGLTGMSCERYVPFLQWLYALR